MTIEMLEQRVATLELELAKLKSVLASSNLLPESSPLPPAKSGWIGKVAGSMAEFPEFAEVVRLGQEWRKSQSFEDESV